MVKERKKILSFQHGMETAFRFWSFCQWNPLQNHHQIPTWGSSPLEVMTATSLVAICIHHSTPSSRPPNLCKGTVSTWGFGEGARVSDLWDRSFYLFIFPEKTCFLQTLITHLQPHIGGHLCFWNDALPQASKENSIFHSKYIRRQNSSTIRMTVIIILLLLSKPQLLLSSLSFYLQ